jgi:hypothetical protein
VDVLHQDTLVLEDVTLRLLVERVVAESCGQPIGPARHDVTNAQVLVDLAGFAVLAEEAAEDPLAAHPEHLGGHAGLGRTLTLTRAGVTALALGREQGDGAGAGMHGRGLDDDATVLNELLNVRARVGVADLRLLGRVEPDLALADASDGRGEPLLGAQVDHDEV